MIDFGPEALHLFSVCAVCVWKNAMANRRELPREKNCETRFHLVQSSQFTHTPNETDTVVVYFDRAPNDTHALTHTETFTRWKVKCCELLVVSCLCRLCSFATVCLCWKMPAANAATKWHIRIRIRARVLFIVCCQPATSPLHAHWLMENRIGLEKKPS